MRLQKTGHHFVSGMALSSNTVPTFTENCFLQARHCQIFLEGTKGTPLLPHPMHVTPAGQRRSTVNFNALCESEKYPIAPRRSFGNGFVDMDYARINIHRIRAGRTSLREPTHAQLTAEAGGLSTVTVGPSNARIAFALSATCLRGVEFLDCRRLEL